MQKATSAKLNRRTLQLILTYAPAGLGHLRIMDSLYHGLPRTVNPVILGSQDRSITTIHRLTSIHPIGRALFEWLQSGPLARQANRYLRWAYRRETQVVHDEITRLVAERFEPPEEILVACTHFALAHKLAAIKTRLQAELHTRVVLVVFVSDDTFQRIWYVDGADLLMVTSEFIREKYLAFGKEIGKPVRIEVVPYPQNPQFTIRLTDRQYGNRAGQLDPAVRSTVQMSIPISGAAVGTDYFIQLMEGLRKNTGRYRFHIVSKNAPFTRFFLMRLSDKPDVDLRVGGADRQVVDLYDELMDREILSLEVTKPSEHAFKALLETRARGGVILLFSQPVGRQEYDNLDFLIRHGLMPSEQRNVELWDMPDWAADESNNNGLKGLLAEARAWRGVRIPDDPRRAAEFIDWMLINGVFRKMLDANQERKVRDRNHEVLGFEGVSRFWDLAASI